MHSHLPSPAGFNLPYGVTLKDIDNITEPEFDCDNCGAPCPSRQLMMCPECGDSACPDCYNKKKEMCNNCAKRSPCCGVEFDEDIRICPSCGEHC